MLEFAKVRREREKDKSAREDGSCSRVLLIDDVCKGCVTIVVEIINHSSHLLLVGT